MICEIKIADTCNYIKLYKSYIRKRNIKVKKYIINVVLFKICNIQESMGKYFSKVFQGKNECSRNLRGDTLSFLRETFVSRRVFYGFVPTSASCWRKFLC